MDSFIYPGKIFHEGRGRFQLPGNVVEIEHDVEYLCHIFQNLLIVFFLKCGIFPYTLHHAIPYSDMSII